MILMLRQHCKPLIKTGENERYALLQKKKQPNKQNRQVEKTFLILAGVTGKLGKRQKEKKQWKKAKEEKEGKRCDYMFLFLKQ